MRNGSGGRTAGRKTRTAGRVIGGKPSADCRPERTEPRYVRCRGMALGKGEHAVALQSKYRPQSLSFATLPDLTMKPQGEGQ